MQFSLLILLYAFTLGHLSKMKVFLLLSLVAMATAVRYERYHVFQMGPLKNENELQVVVNLVDKDERLKQVILLNDDVSKLSTVNIAVNPEIVDRFMEILEENSIGYKIVDTDLQRSFDKTMELNQKAMLRYAKDDGISAFAHDAYLTYSEQVAFIGSLAGESDIADTFNIGTSYEGRTLTAISINANNEALPGIWIDSSIHSNEWLASATVLYIADMILNNDSSDAVYLRTNFRWYILPTVNPDGYEYSRTSDRLWRKTRSPIAGSTCFGVDANRNFDSNFGGDGSSDVACADTYRGLFPFSEPETQAQSDFMMTISSFTNLCLSIHTYGQLWLVPWAGYPDKPDDYDELARVGDAAVAAIESVSGRQFVVGTAPDLLYVASGSTHDWAKEKAGIVYSYTPELRPATPDDGGFDLPPSNIIPSGEEMLAAVVACALEAEIKL